MHLVYSARRRQDLLYQDELEQLVSNHRAATITLTREPAADWKGRRGRVDGDLLSESGWPPEHEPHCYICGPTPFVEAVTNALVAFGHGADNVRAEPFGPAGGR